MITAVEGVRVGHWTDTTAATGCTVVLFPEGTVASAEVRGGAPASRELDLLDPSRTVSRLDAVALCGGSAFGLAAADGVMRWCEEHGAGFPTAAGPVPIVAALGLFDLGVGDAAVRPTAEAGYAACAAAATGDVPLGQVGAGTGCTMGKWRGREHATPGGLGASVARDGEAVVAALVAVNSVGGIRQPGEMRIPVPPTAAFTEGEATTIGVIVTNARLSKVECLLTAQAGHDGLAAALDPVHTAGDGDALVAAATGAVDPHPWVVRALAAYVVDAAVRDAAARAGAAGPGMAGAGAP